MATTPDVQIPGHAVSDAADVRQPVRGLLEDLNLLGTAEEDQKAQGFQSAFAGPPQSIAIIEAGATAASKWWAAGLSGAVLAAWASVAAWWPNQDTNIREVILGGAALVTAALVIAIAYLIASDVRGRAAAAVSIVEARARLATTMLQTAAGIYAPTPMACVRDIIPLPGRIRVKNLGRPAADENGWLAVAMERDGDGAVSYIVVKGSVEAKVPASGLDFDSQD